VFQERCELSDRYKIPKKPKPKEGKYYVTKHKTLEIQQYFYAKATTKLSSFKVVT
jgi:hypothetical protein